MNGWHHEPGTSQIVFVRYAVSDHQIAGTGHDVASGLLSVLTSHLEPVLTECANITPDALATIVDLSGVLEALADYLEKETLLRIAALDLALCHGEERSVQLGKIFSEEVSVAGLYGPLASKGIIKAVNVVSAGGDGGSGITAVDKEIPKAVSICDTSWEAHTHATDGEGLVGGIPTSGRGGLGGNRRTVGTIGIAIGVSIGVSIGVTISVTIGVTIGGRGALTSIDPIPLGSPRGRSRNKSHVET